MDVEYTVKIKGKNLPVFLKGLKKGVIAKIVITFVGAKKKDLKSPMFIREVWDKQDEILKDCVEITHKILKK